MCGVVCVIGVVCLNLWYVVDGECGGMWYGCECVPVVGVTVVGVGVRS